MDLPALKKHRGVEKSTLTRALTYAHSEDAKAATIQTLRNRKLLVEASFQRFEQHQLSIEEKCDTDVALAEQMTEREEVENKYIEIVSTLDELIDKHAVQASVPPAVMQSSSTPQVKLPTLDIPSFSGKYEEWSSFHDLFSAIVHQNINLTGAQKLQYLKKAMVGEATGLLRSMPVTDANYTEAWQILIDRYDNKRQIVSAHLKTLFSQQPASSESASELRKLLDTSIECVRALKALNRPVNQWDDILVHTIARKLDSQSREKWESHAIANELPTFDELTSFMEGRCRILEALNTSKPRRQPQQAGNNRHIGVHLGQPNTSNQSCLACGENHQLFQCKKFEAMAVDDRITLVSKEKDRKKSVCKNCLRRGHWTPDCRSGGCRKCSRKHNTLLHKEAGDKRQTVSLPLNHHDSNSTDIENSILTSHFTNTHKYVLLSTAIILVEDFRGELHKVRALLDSGSQSSFITEACMQRLKLRRRSANIPVKGLGSTNSGTTQGVVELIIKSSVNSSFVTEATAFILPKITGYQPTRKVNPGKWSHLTNITLADPTYHIPGEIEILLGNDIFAELLLGDKILGSSNQPSAQHTVFGWILSGRISNDAVYNYGLTITSHISSHEEIQDKLQQFWEIEEVPSTSPYTSEELKCEQHFAQTTSIDKASGRYVTRLPFKDSAPGLGNSRDVAIRRLKLMECKLNGKPQQMDEYRKFMTEYKELGHMKLVEHDQINKPEAFYLPHHFVVKESSTTTKFRVVFDASARVTGGGSLNSHLMVGPKLQDDLVTLLIRFRTNKVAVTADIAKMYRQILMHPEDCDYLRIVWRDDCKEPVQHYQLLTVTYGTSCAPYTAQKILKILAEEKKTSHPRAAAVMEHDFYMDDLLSGARDSNGAIELAKDLISIFKSRGMELRKWSSNDPVLLAALPQELRETQVPLNISSDDSIKTLGIIWHPGLDQFTFKVSLPLISTSTIVTKRKILSETAQLFDPMGLLAPVILLPKLIFQRLWTSGYGWDDKITGKIADDWIRFRTDLKAIEGIRIPRYIGTVHETSQLHGFADASERAYGAVIYFRSGLEKSTVSLIASKTRVAPVKQVSLPRLELCAAVLLTKLMTSVLKSVSVPVKNVYLWSDSTVTLSWLRSHSSKWKTFVANRVSTIQCSFPPCHWRHVSGKNNPADLASRGVNPQDLQTSRLWWCGPWWLSSCESDFPPHHIGEDSENTQLEQRKIHTFVNAFVMNSDHVIFRYNNLNKVIRTVGWCLRFVANCKQKLHASAESSSTINHGPLTTQELHSSLLQLVKVVQDEVFHREVQCCKEQDDLPSNSKLCSLNPFLDTNGILRVGGRLRNAQIPHDQKFPIVLPKSHKLTELIVCDTHIRNLHSGAQLTLTLLQRQFWILGARQTIKRLIHQCIPCYRQRAAVGQQIMADLPNIRVEPCHPFLKVGVDYAGPIYVKPLPGRGQRARKSYIALFVCLTTRAIHLEYVSDLTTAGFIAALERMIALRGKCSVIMSDSGGNFIGAKHELSELRRLLLSQTHTDAVQRALEKDGISFRTIPPGSPSFGGIWESGVKSTKHHLIRVVGKNVLTIEEMSTLLYKISSCLNSRPLTAIPSDPSEIQALTPGHFLIGRPMNAIPQPNLQELKINRLDRWQLVQRLHQDFWQRWSSEFLCRLQQRPKWTRRSPNFKVNDIVLIKDERLPPLKWLLGKIIQTHPDKNGIVRVCTVKTENGELTRPILKLCSLPFNQD